jgi:hypothetical protein
MYVLKMEDTMVHSPPQPRKFWNVGDQSKDPKIGERLKMIVGLMACG